MSIGPERTEPINELPFPFDDDIDGTEAPKRPLVPSDNPVTPFELVCGEPDADTAWMLVGVAQARAAAECEPDGVAVYCVDPRNYFAPTSPDGLDAVDGKHVLIFPKGDAAANHAVFDRSTAFGRLCADEGADVEFAWLGANLDVHLGDRDLAQRKRRLARAVTRTGTKPAKAKPAARRSPSRRLRASAPHSSRKPERQVGSLSMWATIDGPC